MKQTIKFILLSCLLLVIMALAISCGDDSSPFEDYDDNGYTVSVKFDANGGAFTTNTTTIIDTYNLEKYTSNSQGQKELQLFSPDAAIRGNQAYYATKEGYNLAGWYAKRTEVKDADGNVTGYKYDEYWDFDSDKLAVDANGEYSSKDAILTLYAAWVPSFTYEFYVFDDNDVPTLVNTLAFNPLADTTIPLPCNDEKTGKINAPNKYFLTISGKTYDKIYLDVDKTTEVTTDTMTHNGYFDQETATLENPVMKIYCTTTDGVQYKITSPNQISENPDLNAIYTLENDLDFTDTYWPALFMTNDFKGKFIGNGHTIKNLTLTQNNNAVSTFGLFGRIADNASVKDVTFENITVTIKAFSSSRNATFGIFAGEIMTGADVSGIVLKDSRLEITKGLNLLAAVNTRNPQFGLVCASGEITGITYTPDDVAAELTGTDESTRYSFQPDEHGQFTLTIVVEQ